MKDATTRRDADVLTRDDADEFAGPYIEFGYRRGASSYTWADSDGELDNIEGSGFLPARFVTEPSEAQILALHESALRGSRVLLRREVTAFEVCKVPSGLEATFSGVIVREEPADVGGEGFRLITLRVPA